MMGGQAEEILTVEVVTAIVMGMPALLKEGMSWREIKTRAMYATPVKLAERPEGGTELRIGAARAPRCPRVPPAARTVVRDGAEVPLRAKEFDLLARLAAEAGTVVTRETLMSDVWDEHWSGSTKTLDVHIAALRRKLGARPAIATVRGHGYRLERPGV